MAPAKYLVPTVLILENVPDSVSGKVLSLLDVPGYTTSALFFLFYPRVVESRLGWAGVWATLSMMVCISTCCVCLQQMMARSSTTKHQANEQKSK
eukprot:COSAG01_NODE_45_length_32100_cov_28.037218_24_plen_95_part_00